LKDWIEIAAIFLGPFTALLVQRYFDRRNEVRRQQENLYGTLMRLRAASLTPDYVNALNLIDVVFHRKKKSEKLIRERWKILMDHFNDKQSNVWEEKRQDLSVNLLAAIGEHLGYKFDQSQIKRQVYFPVALSEQWTESNQVRKRLLEVLDGKGTRKIPVAIFETKFPETK
jgi:septum formation topological specificity factor MinE